MDRLFGAVLAFGLSVLVLVLSSAQAHRSGCHRWHSCPSDTGSYVCGDLGYFTFCPGGAPATTEPQPAAQPNNRSLGAIAAPSGPPRPRYVIAGVNYIRAGSVNGTVGSVSKLGGGWYRLTVKNATIQLRLGYRAVTVRAKPGAAPSRAMLGSVPVVLQGQLYIPAATLRLAGCSVDGQQYGGYVQVVCGYTSAVFDAVIW
jgi:hypothetical protein